MQSEASSAGIRRHDEELKLPRRRKRWPLVVVFFGFIAWTVIPGQVDRFAGKPPGELWSAAISLAVTLLAAAFLSVLYLWFLHRPSRTMDRKLRLSGLEPITTSMSRDLEEAIWALKRVRLASRWSRSGAFLAFVDVGPKFEIWRSRHGRDECVVRVPWSRVMSWELGSVTWGLNDDPAVVLILRHEGQTLHLPICPQKCGRLFTGAASSREFADVVRKFQLKLTDPSKGLEGSVL